jgi:hypothetical protein
VRGIPTGTARANDGCDRLLARMQDPNRNSAKLRRSPFTEY